MNKKIFLIILVIALIGFATGYNYYEFTKTSSVDFSNCFLFGLHGIIESKSFRKICVESAISCFGFLAVFLGGAFFRWFFPLSGLSLFFLNFRMGVVFNSVMSLCLKSDLISVVFIAILSLTVMFFSCLLFYRCFCFMREHKKIYFYHLAELKHFFIDFVLFGVLIFSLISMIYISKCSINGLYFTII